MRRSLAFSRIFLTAVFVTLAGTPAAAQAPSPGPPPQQNSTERLQKQREELDRIRRERSDLEKRMRDLRTTVHDLSEERTNIERQAEATSRAVRTLDQQLQSLGEEENNTTADLIRAQDELAGKRAALQHRVREIYKRGAMYSFEALLSAQSFGELVARYKYLHLVAQRDQALVQRVESLRSVIDRQRQTLVLLHDNVETSRQEKSDEEKRLRGLEGERSRSLQQAQSKQKQAAARYAQILKDEQRLTGAIANLESERKRAEGRSGTSIPTTSTLKTSDFGKLDWPVEGEIIYRFGRFVGTGGTTLRWNGVGIAAPEGTPVKAVTAGTVAEVFQSLSTFGPTIVLHNGGGAYTVYSSLGKISVTKGAKIAKGQMIGTVGKTDPELGPHLHFEIRPTGQQAVDPLEWLRSRR